jgi:dTDP-3-amino-3,4,6-trideoxy-alpha-D-glucose transaminase
MIKFLDLQGIYRQDQVEYDAAYRRVMDSGRWIMGPELEAFETEFAAFGGRRHAIGVGNGLDALALALQVAGIGAGDEVLVPAHTFIASWLAVRMVGAVPRPVEPAPGLYNIDAAGVEAALTARTRAVMPVHLYGAPADPAAIRRLCEARGLLLLEDAAQAHGTRHRGEATGGFGRLAAYSFYPGKNLGAFGDAGAVVTDDNALAAALRTRRNYGSAVRYQHDSEGVNSRLDELQAAFLRVRLARLPAHNELRRAQAARYAERLVGAPGLALPAVPEGDEPVWHLFVVRHPQRDELREALAAQGIETLIHYPKPVYRFPPFAQHAPPGRSASDTLCDEVLSLPIGPHLQLDDIDCVADAVLAFCEGRSK